jgi:hypothetical protein
MIFLRRDLQGTKLGKSNLLPQIAAIAGVFIVCPAALHALAPISLAMVQVVLDLCQLGITILRIST